MPTATEEVVGMALWLTANVFWATLALVRDYLGALVATSDEHRCNDCFLGHGLSPASHVRWETPRQSVALCLSAIPTTEVQIDGLMATHCLCDSEKDEYVPALLKLGELQLGGHENFPCTLYLSLSRRHMPKISQGKTIVTIHRIYGSTTYFPLYYQRRREFYL